MAWERLNDPHLRSEMDQDTFAELCKEAGYSEEAIAQAVKERAYQRLKRDMPV
jgi:hypothetical protein